MTVYNTLFVEKVVNFKFIYKIRSKLFNFFQIILFDRSHYQFCFYLFITNFQIALEQTIREQEAKDATSADLRIRKTQVKKGMVYFVNTFIIILFK